MKNPIGWILGVIFAGSLTNYSAAFAQPAGTSMPDNDQASQVKDSPSPVTESPVQTGDASLSSGEEAVGTDDPDKPWNRDVSMADRQAAKELFLEGNRLFRIPLYNRAVYSYLSALARWKNPAFYFNLALAQSNLGQEVEARGSLEHALEYGDGPLGSDRFQEAKRELEEITRKLGRIRLSCRTVGAEVTLDGTLLFIGPGTYEGWIKAKAHELTAKKGGYQSEARRVAIRSGAVVDIDLSLVTLSQATDTSRRWATWKPWSIVAIGGVVATAGGVIHTTSATKYSEFDRDFSSLQCAQQKGCASSEITLTLKQTLKSARQRQSIAIAGYISGGLLAVTGVILLYMNRPRLLEHSGKKRYDFRLTPDFSTNGISISISSMH